METDPLKCPTVVLGSRSPRRLELLNLLLPNWHIEIISPESADEAGFDGLDDWRAIEERATAIARAKCRNVLSRLKPSESGNRFHYTELAAVVTADTVVIANRPDGRLIALGQPPMSEDWEHIVSAWFRDYFTGRTHHVLTALCVSVPSGRLIECTVKTAVTFHPNVDRYLDWYLATQEPCGKAGGYAVQGAGSLFVKAIEGSPSNVVGLPLKELMDIFIDLNIPTASSIE